MDDFKMFAKNDQNLSEMLKIVKTLSDYIRIKSIPVSAQTNNKNRKIFIL